VFVAGIMMVMAGAAEAIKAFQMLDLGQLAALLRVSALWVVPGLFAFERRARAEAPRLKTPGNGPWWANFSYKRREIETSICGARLTR